MSRTTRAISVTLDKDLLEYLDQLASSQHRTRSAMIAAILRYLQEQAPAPVED